MLKTQLIAMLESLPVYARTIEFLRRRHAPLERHPDVLQHPVAAFRLIRRLASDWDRITDPARITGDGTQMGFVESKYNYSILNWSL